jgi:hypothetical protein
LSKLALVLAAALSIGCALTPEKWPHEPFTAEAWKAATWEQRYVYYESLAEQRLLDGATRERVIELLGPGNIKSEPASITYLIRRRPLNPWMADVRVLDIRLTPEGKVERYFIRGT